MLYWTWQSKGSLCAAPCYGGASAWLSQVCPALEPRVLRATDGHSHVRGLPAVVPDHRSSLRTACPKGQWLHPQVSKSQLQFQLNLAPALGPASAPAPTPVCDGPRRLSCGGTDGMHQVICHTALHFQRRACHLPGGRSCHISHATRASTGSGALGQESSQNPIVSQIPLQPRNIEIRLL